MSHRTFVLPRGTLALALTMLASVGAGAQERDRRPSRDTIPDERSLPREIAREVTELFNAPGTLRASGSLNIATDREIEGDVAVLNGPLTVSGRIRGRVVAINADIILKPSARIDGDILVVGGTIEGKEDARLDGDLRVYKQVLYYRHEGERIVVERGRDPDEEERAWHRWRRRRDRSWSDLTLVSARTYNRVEGLPILFGPQFRSDGDWIRLNADVLGIARTADRLRWDGDNIGHSAKLELKFGRPHGIAVGGKLFDVVDAVETWQLRDDEVGLASFFLHRDYRDYFDRHGGTGYAAIFITDNIDLTAALSDQTWRSRDARDPYTLFRNAELWRVNPEMDAGRLHIANATLRIDTRNDDNDPWSGWYIVADAERGTGRLSSVAPTSLGVRTQSTGDISYDRAFLDLRRYNRLSPNASLSMRVVVGGWVDGDPLPLQRRFSVGGPGSLPGFDFRSTGAGDDVGQCSIGTAPLGHPAQCDRVALAQVEYRGDLHIDLFNWGDDDWSRSRSRHRNDWDWDGMWVVFADAGRGWLVGSPATGAATTNLHYSKNEMPPWSTFRTDIGAGLDLNPVGFYIAKSVSHKKEPPNFFVRIHKRF